MDTAPTKVLPGYGAFWTIAPSLIHDARPARLAESTPFRWSVDDPELGTVPLQGWLDRPRGQTDTLYILVHGLGGGSDSGYLRHAAKNLTETGAAVLRVGLRGTDGIAPDFYHAKLTVDLHAAIAHPRLVDYARIFVVGFSLGGQMALSLATEPLDERVMGVAAVCPPLDLAAAQSHLDGQRFSVFRPYVLKNMRRQYRRIHEVAQTAGVTLPLAIEDIHLLASVYDFDQYVVVPRFGFESVAQYYAEASAGPGLPKLRIPALVVATPHDPMVPFDSLRPYLERPGPRLTVRITPGGHVGFPRRLDLGIDAPLGLVSQIKGWLETR